MAGKFAGVTELGKPVLTKAVPRLKPAKLNASTRMYPRAPLPPLLCPVPPVASKDALPVTELATRRIAPPDPPPPPAPFPQLGMLPPLPPRTLIVLLWI